MVKRIALACMVALLGFAVAGCSDEGAEPGVGEPGESEARYSASINGEMCYADSLEEISSLIEENSIVELGADEINYVEVDDLIEIVSGGFEGSDCGYANFSFKATNLTSFAIDCVTLNICLLDESGNIVESTYPQEQVVVDPGQSLVVDALVDEAVGAYSAKVTGYSFEAASGDIYVTGSVGESPEVVLG